MKTNNISKEEACKILNKDSYSDLKQQIEDLKCCGNCGVREERCLVFQENDRVESYECCEHWKFDNVTHAERMRG